MKWEQISLLLTILTTIITASVSIQPIYLTNSLTANSNDFKQSGIMIINVNDYNGSTDTERIQKALDDVPPEGQ